MDNFAPIKALPGFLRMARIFGRIYSSAGMRVPEPDSTIALATAFLTDVARQKQFPAH
ncbi:MAG TPA: hypothetical protein PKV71_02130 [Calditrichia bacterium]|nr:hypothetical protein [Calditrichia bacterium]